MLPLLNQIFAPFPTRSDDNEQQLRAQRHLQLAQQETGRWTAARSQQDCMDAFIYGFSPLRLLAPGGSPHRFDEAARIAVEGEDVAG